MVIYTRYVTHTAEICTTFFKILNLKNGMAETVEEAVVAYLESKSIPMIRLVGLEVMERQ